VEGLVADAAGAPCPGAEVRIEFRVPGQERPLPGPRCHAGEDGAYALDGIPRMEGSLAAAHGGGRSDPVELAPPGAGDRVRRDLAVLRTPGLAGRVTAADGRPLEGILVSAVKEGAPGARVAETAADGSWEIRGLATASYRLTISDPRAAFLAAREEGVLAPRAHLHHVLEPDPEAPGTVVFRVAAPDGRPVRAARITEYRAGSDSPAGTSDVHPDPDGAWRRPRTWAGRYRFVLRCPEGTAESGPFDVRPGETRDLGTLPLAAGVAVRGRVLAPGGGRLEGARVHVGDEPVPERAPPDAEGRFAVEGLPPSAGTIRVEAPGHDPVLFPWQGAAGAAVDLGERRATVAAGVLRVTVRAASGAFPAGLLVAADRTGSFLPGEAPHRAPVGVDGRAVLRGLAAGRWLTSAVVEAPAAAAPGLGTFSTGRAGPTVDLGPGEEKEVEILLR
jgi:hypothetical protein